MRRDAEPSWLRAAGPMADVVRAHDWSATPLGPIGAWPQSLRTTAELVLSGGFACVAMWGPSLVQLYNDAYRDLMGSRHPRGLGQPVRECWPEAWGLVAPILERVLAGESLRFEDKHFSMVLDGLRVDAWFTLSYGPLRDDAGEIAGVLVTMFETTGRHIAEGEREASFFHLVERNPFGMYVIDADFRIRATSLGAAPVFSGEAPVEGRDLAEVLRALWEEPFASEAIGRFRHTLATGEPFSSPHTAEKRQGDAGVEAYDWRIERITMPDGRFGVVCYFYDLSEQVRARAALRDSEERFRLLADTMPQIVWATRPDGYHDYFNERWYEYTGMPRPHEPGGEYDPQGSGQGWNWKDYLHPDDFGPTLAAWQRSLATGEPYHVEYRFKRHDGEYRWFIGLALPLRDDAGAIVRWFGTLTDIDDQKSGERQRDALIEQLRDADRAKDDFLAMLSHEVRNPLAPIRSGFAVLARETLTPVGRAALAIGRRQLVQLTRLVDDLLEATRVTRRLIELRPERIELQPAVRDAVDSVRPLIDERRQQVALELPDAPVRLAADPARLAQIVENLLTNASKYSDPETTIGVRVAVDGGDATIAVSDRGIGIAPEHVSRLFVPFSQIDATIDRSRGGLGLGLALVKHLAELHGGSVTVSSEGAGRGSTFTVRVPRLVD